MKAKPGAHSSGLSGNSELPLHKTSYIDSVPAVYETPRRPAAGQDMSVLVIIVGKHGAASASLVHWIESMPGVSAVAQVTDFASVYLYCQRGDAGALIEKAGEAAGTATAVGTGEAGQIDGPHIEQLSSRELEVFQMLSRGMSNRQLARSLGITERTVKAHIGSIMRKLGLQSRLQVGLAALAHQPEGAGRQTG